MEKSRFQFTNPILKRLEFTLHDDFSKRGRTEMGINLSANFQRTQNEDQTLANTALVSVTISVGAKDNSTPFYIEAEEEANFKWEENIFTEEQIDALLNHNAVALLISYLRPIIANITAASPYPTYNLPYIDLTSKSEF